MGQGVVLVWAVLAALCFAPAPLALEQCPPVSGATQIIQQNCQWKEAAGTGAVTLLGPPAGVDSIPPVIAVGSTAATAPGKVTPGTCVYNTSTTTSKAASSRGSVCWCPCQRAAAALSSVALHDELLLGFVSCEKW